MYQIYKATNLINGKAYVGFTSRNIQQRKAEHYDDAKYEKNKSYFHKALLKYPEENWYWEIVARGSDEIDGLKSWEPFYIKAFNTKVPNGYNLSDGGEGNPGFKFTAEQAARCGYKQTPCKCLELNIEFRTTAEAARYLSNIVNKQCDKSFIQKCCKRKERQAYGFHFSYINDNSTVEDIDSMFEIQQRKIICVETNQIFNNMEAAAKWCGSDRSTLRKAIINNWQCKNYHWIYA